MLRDRIGPNARVNHRPCVTRRRSRTSGNTASWTASSPSGTGRMFGTQGISLAECEESGFDGEPAGDSRFFPIEGGVMRTPRWVSTSSGEWPRERFEEVREALTARGKPPCEVVEPPLSARCITARHSEDRNIYERRQDLVAFASGNPGTARMTRTVPTSRGFSAAPVAEPDDITVNASAARSKIRQRFVPRTAQLRRVGYPPAVDKAVG